MCKTGLKTTWTEDFILFEIRQHVSFKDQAKLDVFMLICFSYLQNLFVSNKQILILKKNQWFLMLLSFGFVKGKYIGRKYWSRSQTTFTSLQTSKVVRYEINFKFTNLFTPNRGLIEWSTNRQLSLQEASICSVGYGELKYLLFWSFEFLLIQN